METAKQNELADGQWVEVAGSGTRKYTLKNSGGVYSCSCPAWRNQSVGIERRTCKHLKAYLGAAAELARAGQPAGDEAQAATKPDKQGPPVMLAEAWENDLDLSGWWMSEKLDGVRAYWTGKTFLSRQGNEFLAPAWFTEGLPEVILDGELWSGRRKFQETVGIARRQDRADAWKKLGFVVFDAPAHAGPFEERLAFLKEALASRGALEYARALGHERCRGVEHLREELARVEALGGEGLMLRQPGSPYVAGRSSTLLKVKNFRDAEATVIEHLPGAGRHKGRLGALRVRLPDGVEFSIGTGLSDAERVSPPPVGSVVTFRYQELSDAGVPRFPAYLRAGR